VSGSVRVDAKPFTVTDPLDLVLPSSTGRLQLWATDAAGAVVARTCVDITG
jgi:hypothetical protein